MIPTDQEQREESSEQVIVAATASLNRAQQATMRAEKAIDAALMAGRKAQQQLAERKRGRA